MYPSLLNLQSPPLPLNQRSTEFVRAMQARFSDAYIFLVDANTNGWNSQQTIAFRRHAPSAVRPFGTFSSIFDDNMELIGKDQPQFWAYSVGFGYQPDPPEDGDPNSEVPTGGLTEKKVFGGSFGFSVVWIESIRERQFGIGGENVPVTLEVTFTTLAETNTLTGYYLNDLYGVIAHEIGHSPGGQSGRADHAEGGLMSEGSPAILTPFSAKTVNRFRWSTQWTE